MEEVVGSEEKERLCRRGEVEFPGCSSEELVGVCANDEDSTLASGV